MPSQKTLRRRRGRAIRRARRRPIKSWADYIRAVELPLVVHARAVAETLRVAFLRITPMLLPPDTRGAGARRQLLHQGRAPRARRGGGGDGGL